MAECICYLLPPEMHTTHYGATEPGSMYEPNPDCPEHFSKPTYRLADQGLGDNLARTTKNGDNNE